jgi:hypothetical protein
MKAHPCDHETPSRAISAGFFGANSGFGSETNARMRFPGEEQLCHSPNRRRQMRPREQRQQGVGGLLARWAGRSRHGLIDGVQEFTERSLPALLPSTRGCILRFMFGSEAPDPIEVVGGDGESVSLPATDDQLVGEHIRRGDAVLLLPHPIRPEKRPPNNGVPAGPGAELREDRGRGGLPGTKVSRFTRSGSADPCPSGTGMTST